MSYNRTCRPNWQVSSIFKMGNCFSSLAIVKIVRPVYMYIFTFMCICMCVRLCLRGRERECVFVLLLYGKDRAPCALDCVYRRESVCLCLILSYVVKTARPIHIHVCV